MDFKNAAVVEVPFIDTRMGFFYDEDDKGQTIRNIQVGTFWILDPFTSQLSTFQVLEEDYKLYIMGMRINFAFTYMDPEDQLFVDQSFNYYTIHNDDDVVLVPVVRAVNNLVVERPNNYYGKVMERSIM
jgi:hypothetical protein